MKQDTNVVRLRRTMAFLELKGLDTITLSTISLGYKSVELGYWHNEITVGERQLIKKIFCQNAKIQSDYGSSKKWRGTYKIDEDLEIRVFIENTLVCHKQTPEDLANWTDQDWDRFKQRAMEGEVDVTNCETPPALEHKED